MLVKVLIREPYSKVVIQSFEVPVYTGQKSRFENLLDNIVFANCLRNLDDKTLYYLSPEGVFKQGEGFAFMKCGDSFSVLRLQSKFTLLQFKLYKEGYRGVTKNYYDKMPFDMNDCLTTLYIYDHLLNTFEESMDIMDILFSI